MDCKEFYFKGKEDLDIHVYKWTSKIVNPKAVVQIAHGMSETAIRYEEFAKKLTENGYIVYIDFHIPLCIFDLQKNPYYDQINILVNQDFLLLLY